MPRKNIQGEEGRPLLNATADNVPGVQGSLYAPTTSGAPGGYSSPLDPVKVTGSDIFEVLRGEGIDITEEFKVESVQVKKASGAGKAGKVLMTLLVGVTGVGAIYELAKLKLVKRGNVGLVMDNGVPELIGPGWHLLLSPLRSFERQVPVAQERIVHGTINVVTIKEGFVGLILDKGTPILIPPGMHQWDSETKIYVGAYDLSQPVTKLGPYTLLIVHDGTVGVTHNNGRLDIRGAGYHVLKHERHLYYCELDVTDQFDELNDVDLITRDNVPVNVDCTVHFKINNPGKAALEAGKMPEIRKLVMREARAAMASSVLQSTVSELELLTGDEMGGGAETSPTDLLGDSAVAASASTNDIGKSEAAYEGRKGPTKRSTYIFRAQRSMNTIGVSLIKIAIRKIKILDPAITKKLAQQASIRVTRLEKLDTAEVESRTIDIDAKARARAEVTHAEAQAQRTRIMAEARLFEAKKIQQAAELLDGNQTARVLAELSGLADVLKHTSTNTIFIGSGEGGASSNISNALLGNANFVGSRSTGVSSRPDDADIADITNHKKSGFMDNLGGPPDDFSIS